MTFFKESPMDTLTPLRAQLAPAAPQSSSIGSQESPALAGFDRRIEDACVRACGAIAPAWPLDRAIAVNPHWERTDRSVREVAARMAILGGLTVFPSRATVQSAWKTGRIVASDLAEVLAPTAN